jgi:putative PIN family toxin of toxin-antitoxin system
MRVFLDTNVIISAVTTRGLCADLFRTVLTDHELITCSQVLQEVRRILSTKFSVPDKLIYEYLDLINQDAIIAEPNDLPNVQIRDKDDVEIIGAAIVGKAEVFVTGDRELHGIKSIRKVRILSPRAFWKELTARQDDTPDGR